ncbi:allatotropins-like isoform X1 [Pieris rapae]|uniref:allatotropins-like isoform X1 n=1 Tax=Pieris rapae TaxID=64459 RepID=UPI001E28003A|nr:allatotropins-like isoform X1 [Pieris rapae]
MNLKMQVAVLVAVFLCMVDGAPDGRLVRSKQQRPTRGFKNVEMMTARGFGKRAQTRSERDVTQQTASPRMNRGTPTFKSPSVGIARDFGKRTPELDSEGFEEVRPTFIPHVKLMVARNYGKRGDEMNEEEEEIRVSRGSFTPNSNVLIARGYGKRQDENGEVYGLDNFWENLEAIQEKEAQDDEKVLESIPLDWFVNEMQNNPDFTRSVVRKFIDLNQDGELSADELLRNVA